VQKCCKKQPGHFVLFFIKTENAFGHLCKTSSTVKLVEIIGVSIAPKIPYCEKSLFALAQITENKKAHISRAFGVLFYKQRRLLIQPFGDLYQPMRIPDHDPFPASFDEAAPFPVCQHSANGKDRRSRGFSHILSGKRQLNDHFLAADPLADLGSQPKNG
jgi:hypothetical protein